MSKKKFDICLMNPPYSGSTLHLKFINKVLNIADKAVVVCPVKFLTDYAVIEGWKKSITRQYINSFAHKLSDYIYYNENEFNKLFDIYGWCEGIIGVFDNNIHSDLYKQLSKRHNEEISIINKVSKRIYNNEIPSVRSMYNKNNNLPYFIKCTRVHGHVNRPDYYDLTSPELKFSYCVHDKEKKEVYFNTHNEAINFFNSLNTTFCKFLKYLGAYSGDFNNGIPFMTDYTQSWDNERFYKYFNITEKEKNYIDTFFIEFYSRFDKKKYI